MAKEAEIVLQWWDEWINPDAERKGRGNRRAAAAELRRAHNPLEALMQPATMNLLQRLGNRPYKNWADRIGILAAVLAHVRENDNTPIGRVVGPENLSSDTGSNNEKAVLKEGRLRRLLQAEDDELLDQFRRLIQLMGRKANVKNLADLILYWGDKQKQDLIFDYYDVPKGGDQTPSAA